MRAQDFIQIEVGWPAPPERMEDVHTDPSVHRAAVSDMPSRFAKACISMHSFLCSCAGSGTWMASAAGSKLQGSQKTHPGPLWVVPLSGRSGPWNPRNESEIPKCTVSS